MKKVNVLKKEMSKLKGLFCNKVGFSLETILLLGFGKKALDIPPLKDVNGNVIYTWEYTLLIITSYRLFKDEEIICSDEYERNGRTIEESLNIMKMIEGKKVVNIEFDEETYDFYILFEDNLGLYVFNNDLDFDSEIYDFTTFEDLYSVQIKKGRTKIVHEKMEKQFVSEENESNISKISKRKTINGKK